jgi:hypothetical protein
MRAPFAEKDGLFLSIFREFFLSISGIVGLRTTCNVRCYNNRIEFFKGFSNICCKTILFDQISSFETINLYLGYGLKKICYAEGKNKLKIDIYPLRNDPFVCILRRNIPEKEKNVPL